MPGLYSALDYLLFGGLACTLCLSYGQGIIPGSLTFLLILFSNLRFLGGPGGGCLAVTVAGSGEHVLYWVSKY